MKYIIIINITISYLCPVARITIPINIIMNLNIMHYALIMNFGRKPIYNIYLMNFDVKQTVYNVLTF